MHGLAEGLGSGRAQGGVGAQERHLHGPRWRAVHRPAAWSCRAASTASCACSTTRDGALLKEIDTGSPMIAAPMTYTVDGVQYIAMLAGSGGGGWNFWLPGNVAVEQRQ